MIEYRFSGEKPTAGEQGKLSGRAAPFNSSTDIGDIKSGWGFREKISPGAFKKSLKERDIVLLDNHQNERPIARTSAGTLSLREEKDGLHFDATPSNTSYARDLEENIRANNMGGCSFGFTIPDGGESWVRGKDGVDERTINEVVLHEISAVTFPAYGDTNVSARDSLAAARESRERALGPVNEASEEDVKDALGIDPVERTDAETEVQEPDGSLTDGLVDPFSRADVIGLLLEMPEDKLAEARSMLGFLLGRAFPPPKAKQDDKANDTSKDDGKSDASNGTKGKQAGDECPNCDKGKDKSGNKCSHCGGSGMKNGDGQKHESDNGDEADSHDAKNKGSGEKKSETSASETRGDGDTDRSDKERAEAFWAKRQKDKLARLAAAK